MISMHLRELDEILPSSTRSGDVRFTGIATNTKQIQKGNLFIAWKGEEKDGHDFIAEAEKSGAVALVVERQVKTNLPFIVVKNSQQAFGLIAKCWREQFNLPVIAVTGSNGKTTVKNLLAAIFDELYVHDASKYLVNEFSFNNQVGVPLTLSQISAAHHVVVTEMGMNHFGELDNLSRLAEPDVALINNALPSHIAGVGGTVEGVAKAKGEIFNGLKSNGIAILNLGSPYFDYWKGLLTTQELITFGLSSQAMVHAENVRFSEQNIQYRLVTPRGDVDIELPLLGEHNLMNSLAAAAVAIAVNVDPIVIRRAYIHFKSTSRRLERHQLKCGAILIDDAYNANPASTKAAIDAVKLISGRAVLIFGDMLELGDEGKRYHHELGLYAKSAGIKQLLAIGELTKETVAAFGEGAQHFDSQDALYQALPSLLHEGNILLIKGSHSMHLHQLVKRLLNDEK